MVIIKILESLYSSDQLFPLIGLDKKLLSARVNTASNKCQDYPGFVLSWRLIGVMDGSSSSTSSVGLIICANAMDPR